jgi:uncharacterized protein YndB with AHSA1/START domain
MHGRLNTLTVTTPSDLEIVLTRPFDAPARLIFDAMTKPEHVRRWWGCAEDNPEAKFEIDFRVGGKWRYSLGGPHVFYGQYLEIAAPHRLVSTEAYEPYAQHGYVVTLTLEEERGKTLMTSRVRHKTKEGRDGHLQAGMESGAGKTFDRLEDLLQEFADAV